MGSVVEGSGTNDATEVIHPDIVIGPFLPIRPIRVCRERELRPRPQKGSRQDNLSTASIRTDGQRRAVSPIAYGAVLCTSDRDFARFPGPVRRPPIGSVRASVGLRRVEPILAPIGTSGDKRQSTGLASPSLPLPSRVHVLIRSADLRDGEVQSLYFQDHRHDQRAFLALLVDIALEVGADLFFDHAVVCLLFFARKSQGIFDYALGAFH